jgi:hypothetical protein
MLLPKELFWRVVRKMGLGSLILRIHPKSALVQNGWYRSFRENTAVDRNGNLIPWWTYSFIDFIEKRLTKDLRVFEYGCGNSTTWFSKRVSEMISVEHDSLWAEKFSPQLLSEGNCKVIVRELSDGYVEEINNHGLFDIVIIDGRLRLKCFRQSLSSLSPRGIIIWDDSNMPDFAEGSDYALKHGFHEISFSGMVPAIFILSQTSILYRDYNCLGI